MFSFSLYQDSLLGYVVVIFQFSPCYFSIYSGKFSLYVYYIFIVLRHIYIYIYIYMYCYIIYIVYCTSFPPWSNPNLIMFIYFKYIFLLFSLTTFTYEIVIKQPYFSSNPRLTLPGAKFRASAYPDTWNNVKLNRFETKLKQKNTNIKVIK